MKLRLLNFSVATFALAALFLPRHCVASGEAGPSRWAPSAPPERPHSQFARASRYKDKISPDRISELSSRFNPFPEIHPDADVPFYKNLPLYSVNAPPATVEQALRDYKTVGIIGEHDTVLLEYRVGRVDQGPMKEAAQARQVFNADERLHKVSKASIDVGTNIRRYERVDNLPHVDSIPILRPGTSSRRATDTPEQMLGAAKIAPKQFWLENSDGSHALVSPDGYNLQVRPPNADEQARIAKSLRGYDRAEAIYGPEVAAVLHGAPIMPSRDNWRAARIRGPSLKDYKRFTTDSPASDLRTALQADGRFRFYRPASNGRPAVAIRVALDKPAATRGTPYGVHAEDLTLAERYQERVMSVFSKFRHPIPI